MEEKFVDLHLHTRYSDGMDEVRSVVRNVKMKGIEVMAITDHDTMAGYEEAKDETKAWNIELIPGVEVSTKKYHILGLGVDPGNLNFKEFLRQLQKLQELTCQQRIDILNEKGIPLTLEHVRKYSPNSRLGKYNILIAMIRNKEIMRFIDEKNPDESPDEIFRRYIRKGTGLAGNIPNINYVDSREAIMQIHNANGKAIIAHPFKDIEDMKELDVLVEEGLDGIEIQPNYGQRNEPFRQYAKERGLILSHGSDYHGASFGRALLGRGENKLDIEDL